MKKDLTTLGSSLEEAFLRKRDRELINAIRRDKENIKRRMAFSEASGITDPRLSDELAKLGFQIEALASLTLVPIIEVVWADGHMHPDERKAVLAAMGKHGIAKNSSAHTIIEHWLRNQPNSQLLKRWKEYVQALQPTLSPESWRCLKEIVISHSCVAAEAAGGCLGLGRVSVEEQAMIKQIKQILESAEKPSDS
jgi:hypothetical protein